MSDVFISYAHSTAKQARAAAKALRAIGYSVWIDDDLPAHRTFTAVIQEQLSAAKAALVIWSPDAADSEWVLSEANRAREDHKLVQASVDNVRLPMPFDQIQCVDLSDWSGGRHPGWPRVAASIAELVKRAGSQGTAAQAPSASTSGPWRMPRAGAWAWAVAAAMVVAAAGSGAWLMRDRLASRPAVHERVAVLPFDAPAGDVRARDFAVGLTDEILNVLSTNRQQAISRTEAESLRGADRDLAVRRLGVGLLMDGAVQSDGESLRVRAHLDDAREHVTLWSRDFEGLAGNPTALQAQVAAAATDIADWALIARRSSKTPLDAPTMIAMLKGNDLSTDAGTAAMREEAVANLRQVTRRAPDLALGHGTLALVLTGSASAKDEARSEANRAIALNPHTSVAYLALANLEPRGRWRQRETLLLKAIEADPEHSFSYLFEGRFLAAVGRHRDALPYVQRSVALRPLFPGGNATLGDLLVQTGGIDDGLKVLDHAASLWPTNRRTRVERLVAALALDDMDGALALVENPATRSPAIPNAEVAVWRTALQARRSQDRGAMLAAATRVRREAESGSMTPGSAYHLCALLDDLDCAFAEADRAYANSGDETTWLFVGHTRSMRRDPRFMVLAARLGLVDYWRTSGHWPDFCAQPGLPYDCKAEAARLSHAHA